MSTPLALATAGFATAAAVYALRRCRVLRRALRAERAARRLTEALAARDLAEFTARVRAQVVEQQVIADAERVLDAALGAHHQIPPPEGR